ncbi:MAG: ABC transporter ATP-binding protein [Clostridiales bacterium]|nr:ABC transporter ATP-binding protein [Clostridiales bacterium]
MIEVKNLTKRYGDHLAVDNSTFTVNDGEIVGFLGPNGAGKTTTMNMLTGYLSSTEGEIMIDGIDILEDPVHAKMKIGYLPEVPPLYPEMTVNEYLQFACALKKVPARDRKEHVEKLLKECRIKDMQNRLITNLSKGYKQRVGLAAALAGDPDVLILDEPTAGLDPKQITEFRDLIRSLSKNHTIIISSHIMQEIQAVCDKVIIINHGRIIAIDTPEALSQRIMRNNKLELRIKGPRAEIVSGLKEIPGITGVDITRIREEGSIDIQVETEDEADVREQVFELCSSNHFPILQMNISEMTLEDIFLQITGEREA